jgi:hypothetical protein
MRNPLACLTAPDPAGSALPVGYTLVGFGRDKVVYLSVRDASGLKLARVRLR